MPILTGQVADQMIQAFELPNNALDYFLASMTHKKRTSGVF